MTDEGWWVLLLVGFLAVGLGMYGTWPRKDLVLEASPLPRCVTVDAKDRRITITTADCAADWLLEIDGQRKLLDEWSRR